MNRQSHSNLLRTIPLENFESPPSPPSSSTSPSSGYGTEVTSPLTPTLSNNFLWTNQLWSQTFLKDEPKNNCCSLVDPVWRNSTLDHWSAKWPSTSTSLPSPWNYSSFEVHRAIVSVDVERISPSAPPHHPYDMLTSHVSVRKPWGIATSTRTEQFFVTDRQYHVILVFGPDGHYQGVIGEPGKKPGQFRRPTGLAYDAVNDRLVVSDKDNHRIQVFCAATGRLVFSFGSKGDKPGQFSFTWGVAVSPDGNHIAVTDPRNRRVQLFTSSGIYVRHLKIHFSKKYDDPYPASTYLRGIVFDKSGDFLYLTDFNLHRIYRLDMGFTKTDTIVDESGKLTRPSGIDLDQDGNLLVCDTRNNQIRVFHPSGQALGTLRRIGEANLDMPTDLSVMRAGHIAALDLKGRVRIF